MTTESDPYITPESGMDESLIPHSGTLCPKCNQPMQVGEIRSKAEVRWVSELLKKQKTFYKGTALPRKKAAIVDFRYPSLLCEPCQIYIMDQ